MNDFDIISTDVLVVGSGGAGCSAAIEACNVGSKVTLISKGRFLNGCTLNVKTTAAVGLSNNGDNYEIAANDLFKAGYCLGNKEIIKELMKNSYGSVSDLLKYGISLKKECNNNIFLKKYPGHSYPRNIYFESDKLNKELGYGYSHGIAIMESLNNELKKKDVELLENVVLETILTNEEKDRIIGAIVFDCKSGKYISFNCKSIILATGSFTNIYSKTKTSSFETGDGHACAFEAGAELIDMEVIQFDPLSVRICPGMKLYNNNMEEFLKTYGIKDPYESNKESLVYAVAMEILRTNDNIRVDFKDCYTIKDRPTWFDEFVSNYFKQYGKDLKTEVISSTPISHTTFGGINVNQYFESNIKGLYAAGAVVGGIYGFARPKGFSSMIALVSGKLAGRFAAEANIGSSKSKISNKYLREIIQKKNESLCTNRGKEPKYFKDKLHNIVDNYSPAIKEHNKLSAGLDKLSFLEEEIKNTKFKVKNSFDILKSQEIRNLISTAKLHFASCLIRKESRGTFFRSDYPKLNDHHWLKNIILYIQGDEVKVKYLNKKI